MIIDCHVHAFPDFAGASGHADAQTHRALQQARIRDWYGRMVSSSLDLSDAAQPGEDVGFRIGRYGRYEWKKNGRDCWLQRFPPSMDKIEWPPEQMIANMDAVGVQVGILQSGYMQTDYCRTYFAECVERFPGRFVSMVGSAYDANQSDAYLQGELDKLKFAVEHQYAKGVYAGHKKGQAIDDARYDKFWTLLSDLGLPHTFLTGFCGKAEYLDSLDRIDRVLTRFPDLRIVIGHLGGNVRPPGHPEYSDTFEDLMKVLRHRNAYFEVGYVMAYENWTLWGRDYEYPYPQHTELCRRFHSEIGAQRMMWGSDMPNNQRSCTYLQLLDTVRLHFDFLDDRGRTDVLGGTAARLYGIPFE